MPSNDNHEAHDKDRKTNRQSSKGWDYGHESEIPVQASSEIKSARWGETLHSHSSPKIPLAEGGLLALRKADHVSDDETSGQCAESHWKGMVDDILLGTHQHIFGSSGR